jgi:hypothetical protein
LHPHLSRGEFGAQPRRTGGTGGALLLPLREHRQGHNHAAENDLIALFARVADTDTVLRLRKALPDTHVGVGFRDFRFERAQLRTLSNGLQRGVEIGVDRPRQGSIHRDVFPDLQQLPQLTERQGFRRLGRFTLSPDPRQRRARDVDVQHGDIAGFESPIGGRVHGRGELVGGVQ